MNNHWHSNNTNEAEVQPRAEFQAAVMKLWESVRRSGQLIQSLNRDNEHLTAKLGEMDQHMRERSSAVAELQVRLGTLEGDLLAYENLQTNYRLSQENVSEAFLKIQQLERENGELRQQVESFAELEKSLSILQKEIVRRNAEMNSRINETFKLKSQIAELESKAFELNNLRAQLDEAQRNGGFKTAQTDRELEEIIAAQQETIDSYSRQIFELKQAMANGAGFENSFKNFDDSTQNIQQQGFVVDFDSRVEAAVDAVRQEEEKLRDEYEIIMVRQQETLDKYAENLLKSERENAEKDELLKDLQARLGEFEQAYTQQADIISGLQMEVELLKEVESEQISESENNDAQSLTIMIQEISEQKQRAEFERNEIAEELLKTRQMFALAQQQIQDLQKIEDEYARMQGEHSELRQRVDELQNSQKKNGDVSQAVQTLEAKIEELQARFKNVETGAAPKEFIKEEVSQEEKKLPEDIPFKKPETSEPETQPKIEETELPQPEITETEPEEPFKKVPETKTPEPRPKRTAKEKPAANPAKDMVIDRMAALLERLEKSIV
jgi:chromosome segregation ATPase